MSGEVEDFWCINETDQADEKKETRKLVKQKHTLTLSLSHTHVSTLMHMFLHQLPGWEGEPLNNGAFSAVRAFLRRSCLNSRVYLGEPQRPAYLHLSLSVRRPDVSQKQHITRLSLHPEEGLFRSRMLLAELRRIFLTVSLTLCWQTDEKTSPQTKAAQRASDAPL